MLLMPTDFGVLCLVFLLWGSTAWFLWAYAALALANTVFLLVAAVKWFREVRDLDRAQGVQP